MVKNILIVVIIVVVLFLLFKWGFSNGTKEEKSLKALEELPEQYQNFQALSDSFKTEKYHLEGFQLDKYKRTEIVHFNSLDSTLIVMGSNYGRAPQKFPDPLIHVYFKLDKQGNVIDSLELSGEKIAVTRGGYLIGKDYHCSWMLDGDATKKTYQFLNDSLDWDATIEKDMKGFKKLYETATHVVYQEYYINRKRYSSITLLNDGVWTKLHHPKDFEREFRFETFPEKPIVIHDPFPTTRPSEVAGFSHSHLPNLAEDGNIFKGENKYLSMEHYRKAKFVESRSNGTFSSTNATYPAKWEGEAYMHLSYKGNVIPFKIVLDKMKREEDGYQREFGYPLRFYSNEQLNFGIISENYGDLFLIKPL